MYNYFRITAYYPKENISFIADSYGAFEKLWQFSAYLVSKGCKIIEVSKESDFDYGDLPKVEEDSEHIILRACSHGKPTVDGKTIEINGKKYCLI